ncbi:collagen-like protein [bacterium]|nr:collagen-like protein [bacterium]
MEAGLDNKNPNGTLDANEVTKTEYVCNGANGKTGNNALSKVTEITNETTDCKNGGVKIEVGVDADGDGILDESEIDNTQTKFVCNGANGKNGGNGPTGPKGDNGQDGKDGAPGEQGEKGETGAKGDQGIQGETGAKGENGTDGISSLVAVVDEPKGENCVTGGKKISVGLDSNRNGTLDEDEIDPESVYYVCNGRDAEEAGLSSSSTGCSLNTVDENISLISVVFALLTAVLAAFALKKVRS